MTKRWIANLKKPTDSGKKVAIKMCLKSGNNKKIQFFTISLMSPTILEILNFLNSTLFT